MLTRQRACVMILRGTDGMKMEEIKRVVVGWRHPTEMPVAYPL